jgi:hypothetical protein
VSASAPSVEPVAPGRLGLYVVFIGIACEALGFVLLSRGSTTAAPLLLVGGFAVMGLGIWIGWD